MEATYTLNQIKYTNCYPSVYIYTFKTEKNIFYTHYYT